MKLDHITGFMPVTTIALLGIIAAPHALADYPPDSHAPAGVMGDHRHHAGEWMIGYRYFSSDYSDLYFGSDKADPMMAAHAGFSSISTSMSMDMTMLDIMYAPTDNITLMLMPMFMSMDMTMMATPTMMSDDGMDHGAHDMGHTGGVHAHSVSGLGDTMASALIALKESANWSLHANVGVSIPTGSVDEKGADGRFTHYGMQLGSGTWDAMPGLTYMAKRNALSWGGQVSVVLPMEDKNDSGYALGERYNATAWAAYRTTPWLSLSGRLAYQKRGNIDGHFDGPHNHTSPPDLQANYGGEFLDVGLGFNIVAQTGAFAGVRLGLEWVESVSASYNGFQVGREDGLNVSLSYAF